MSAIVGHRRARTRADDISRLPETIGTHDAVGLGEADKVWSRPSSFVRRTPSVVNARLITLVIPAHAGISSRNQHNRPAQQSRAEIPAFAGMTSLWGFGQGSCLGAAGRGVWLVGLGPGGLVWVGPGFRGVLQVSAGCLGRVWLYVAFKRVVPDSLHASFGGHGWGCSWSSAGCDLDGFAGLPRPGNVLLPPAGCQPRRL